MINAPVSDQQARKAGFDPGRLGRLSGLLQRCVDEGKTGGVVVGVARDGIPACLVTAGYQDIVTRRPIQHDTLFRVFSMTKPITTAAVMLLVEETLVKLDDEVATFFPSLRDLQVYVSGDAPPFVTEPVARPITILDLLTHTSGLAYGIGDEHPVEKHFADTVWGTFQTSPDISLSELVEAIGQVPLVHQPGSHWRYSIAIDVLGAIIEKASGIALPVFFKERLFDPLEMNDTFFTVPNEKRHRLATLYRYVEGEELDPEHDPPSMAYLTPNRHPNGGGGLVSTAGDYLRFGQMLLEGGLVCDETACRRVLAPRTVAMMMRNHIDVALPGWDRPGWGFGFGGKVAIDPTRIVGYASPGQYSWGGAASTTFFVDPAERLQMVVMQQIVPGFTNSLREEVETTVYQALAE